MLGPSSAEPPRFPLRIAALRDESARLLRIRPVPAGTGVALLGLLHKAEALAVQRYDRLLASLEAAPNEALQETLTRRRAMEQRHMEALAGRIAVLGAALPDAPETSAGEPPETLPVVVTSLLGKRGMVKLYRAAIRFLMQRDRESAAMLRQILAEEEAHIAAMRVLVLPR